MQYGTVLHMMASLADIKGEKSDYLSIYEGQKDLVNSLGWDGSWYRRCITDAGVYIGSADEMQAKIWINTQTWSVISGMGDTKKQIAAMNSVKKMLDTDIGIKALDPAMQNYPTKEDPLTYYNKGCGENGSIFCHANAWAVIAECMLGRSDNAWKYYHQLLPMEVQKKVGERRYKAEPYVYSSNIFGPENNSFGLANVSWLTGTASWMYIAATQYLLGIRPDYNGLVIDPCLPDQWKDVTIERVFRGCRYRICIRDCSKTAKTYLPHIEGRKNCSIEI